MTIPLSKLKPEFLLLKDLVDPITEDFSTIVTLDDLGNNDAIFSLDLVSSGVPLLFDKLAMTLFR